MRTVKLASLVCILVAGSAFGASNVTFTLGMGGTNNGAANQAGMPWVAMTPGSIADGQSFVQNSTVTWEVRLTASGTQSGGAGAGSPIKGVANFVFDLELHRGSVGGPLETGADFVSTLHNGGTNCAPMAKLCSPACLAGAGFAFNYNVLSQAYDSARVVDPYTSDGCPPSYTEYVPVGGPNMEVYLFPTVPPASGKIIGMGAGYARWEKVDTYAQTQEGVGLASGGLGTGPVCEGQIDMSGLPTGTYVLKVIPGAGVNVLRGDLNLAQNQNAFATPADSTTGDEITFVIGGPPPQDRHLLSAVSRRNHGAAGDKDVTLALSGTASIEPRIGGPTTVILTFDNTVASTLNGGVFTCANNVSMVNATCSNVTGNGTTTMTVSLTGATVNACTKITLTNVANLVGDSDVQIRVLPGDANQDSLVNIGDLNDVKNLLGQAVTGSNFLKDINADSLVNIGDLNDVKNRLGGTLGSCP